MIIDEISSYDHIVDIFIHTNNNFDFNLLNKNKNGNLNIICHDLKGENPFYLTWKCREILKKQKDDYDIFVYVEDDILVPKKTLEYWIKNNDFLISLNYNLGFFRIEISEKDNEEYLTDIPKDKNEFKKINIGENEYFLNDINPYCAFWIYNKKEFNKFVESNFFDPKNIIGYDIREQSSIGLHGLWTSWYKATVIPILNGKIIEDCKIYHLPNNYINNENHAIKFKDIAIM